MTAMQLRYGARAYASEAAEEMLESNAELAERHGQGGFTVWQDFLTQRVTDLATAVEFDEPSMFASEVGWLYSTLSARGVSLADARFALECLSRTLERELSSGAWGDVEPSIGAAMATEPSSMTPSSRIGERQSEETLSREFLTAVLSGDAISATEMILNAFVGGTDAGVLYERVMLPVQAELGTLWQRGELGIADEHIATEVVRGAMTALWQTAAEGSAKRASVIVGSVAGDRHDAGVRAAAQLLDIAGFRGVCIGCDVPAEEFAFAAVRFEAIGAVVSATMTQHLPRVRHTVVALREAIPELRIIVGGPAFGMDAAMASRLAEKVGADAFADRPTVAATLLGAG